MKRLVLAVMLWAGLVGLARAADYEDGWRAYVAGDYIGAYNVWRPLAARGDNQAQLMVGLLYANGQGVEQDIAEAYTWILIAEANGNANAADLYRGASNLDTLLTPQQRAEAERRARAWRPIAGD